LCYTRRGGVSILEPRPTANRHGSATDGVAQEQAGGHAAFPTHFDEPSIDFSARETAITSATIEELRVIAARYPQARSALLPMLHLVQSVEGRVTPAGIEVCADVLDISTAEVSGVATFYTMYKRRPVGRYHVGVCTTALCAVVGGDEVYSRLQEHLGVSTGETTADGAITLEHLECNAACDYAPVMMVNWEFFDQTTPERAVEVVDELRAGGEVTATRGGRVGTWRDAERVLAGFGDHRADEGVTSGSRSQLGLRIARERGWTAPPVAPHRHAEAQQEESR
jgi:NADH-quinone oxidoreductase subunit E